MKYVGYIAYAILFILTFSISKADESAVANWPVGHQIESQMMRPGLFTCKSPEDLRHALENIGTPVLNCGRSRMALLVHVKITEHWDINHHRFAIAEYTVIANLTPFGVQPSDMPPAYGYWTSEKIGEGI